MQHQKIITVFDPERELYNCVPISDFVSEQYRFCLIQLFGLRDKFSTNDLIDSKDLCSGISTWTWKCQCGSFCSAIVMISSLWPRLAAFPKQNWFRSFLKRLAIFSACSSLIDRKPSVVVWLESRSRRILADRLWSNRFDNQAAICFGFSYCSILTLVFREFRISRIYSLGWDYSRFGRENEARLQASSTNSDRNTF